MLVLRLGKPNPPAPDAPSLISSSPADTKPKPLKSHAQTAHKSRLLRANHQTTPAAAAAADKLTSNSNQQQQLQLLQQPQQQPVDSSGAADDGCTTPLGPGNIAAARLLDLGKKLIEATRAGLTEQVRHLVEEAGAPFTSDWLGTTALHVAAQNGFVDIAEILVRGGVNKEARTKLERTALHLAAQSGCLEIVNLLISNGSDVNVRDMLRMTPLHWAVERGHVVVAERLLLAGAHIDISNKFLLTPLDIARESGSLEMIELFKVCDGWLIEKAPHTS
jgi:ankyrin repeat protein